MENEVKLPQALAEDPEAQHVQLICTECRECGSRSDWAEKDTNWDVLHFKAHHPDIRQRKDWRTYRWTITRQIARYL